MHPGELDRLSAAELTSIGRDLILAGRHDLALTVLQTSLEKDPTCRRTYALLEYLLELGGNYQAAYELHEDYKWLSSGRGFA